MQPAAYWREQKKWSDWIGKTGQVVTCTEVKVSAPERGFLTPYFFVLVDFGDVKHSFMGVDGGQFTEGEKVVCVWRKMSQPSPTGLIEYGIKVSKNL